MEFPVIDLDVLVEEQFQQDELKRGLTDVGFFVVKNWGVTVRLNIFDSYHSKHQINVQA